MTARLHIGDGAAQERDKYAEIWTRIPEYRAHSPGLENVDRFVKVMEPDRGATILDIGCGEGVAGLEFRRRGFDVWWLDITDAGLRNVPRHRFICSPIWKAWGPQPGAGGAPWDYGFCCDVMEHIPPEFTMLAAARILESCRVAWFQVALRPDEFGAAIGEPLHLTVRPFDWWLVRLAEIGHVLDARDLCGDGLFVLQGERPAATHTA